MCIFVLLSQFVHMTRNKEKLESSWINKLRNKKKSSILLVRIQIVAWMITIEVKILLL